MLIGYDQPYHVYHTIATVPRVGKITGTQAPHG